MEPDSLPNLEEQYAPQYDERKAKHQSSRDNARAREISELWPVRTGIYKNGLSKDQPESITINGIDLEGMEVVIHKQIMDILAAKNRDNVDNPVVVLDLGGMYGLSSIRLAKATEELVRQGKIVYVVSNLTFNPSKMSDEQVRSAATGLGNPDYDDFFLQNRELVHFIMSDAEELKDTQVTLPNGERLSLFGNIDLIHEQTTLGKSQVLDSDLPTLGKSLSPYGIFFLGDKDAQLTVNPTAFKLGESNLLQSGVNELDLSTDARYRVFMKPKAPSSLINTNTLI